MTGWMYKLSWVFAGHTGLSVGFVVRRIICFVDKHEIYLAVLSSTLSVMTFPLYNTGNEEDFDN